MTVSRVQVTMSSLVNALDASGQWRLAVAKFDELRERGVRPNAYCYNAAISALAKGAQAEAAKQMVVSMRQDGLTPDIFTYGPLIIALGRAGLVNEAMRVRTCVRVA
jgi:pentatricopeptide repeat protein